ncbi:MAG: hypothetical protein ACFFDF_10580 [Candidatus Odinarchaeota archaeon]
MRIKRKTYSFLITFILVSTIVGFALARTQDFNDFSGEGHSSCHGNITQSATGYITLSSSSGLSVNPSETFTISIQVLSFTEAQGNTIVAGFPSGTPGLGNNKDFTFSTTQQSISIDSSGNSIIIDFQVTAPSIENTYTLHADAIYRAGGSASYFSHGDLILTVEIQNNPPQFSNLIENSDPLELGLQETIQVDVIDSETSVSNVFIELAGINYTMTNTLSNTYEYSWIPNTIGVKNYIIYANDTDGSWNSISGNILVIDTTAPILSNLVESSDPLELGQTETIQVNVTDLSGISQVSIEINGINYSLVNIFGSTWEYNSWTPTNTGLKPYVIYANDTLGNLNSISSDITIMDTIAPTFAFLVESADPLPLGQNETISIEVYDSPGSGIKEVLLEYENFNHTMNFIGFNTWYWSNWEPLSIGIFDYTIYMTDNSNNLNLTTGSIEVILSSGPTIQNLSKSPNPLELGQTETIQVDVDDNDGVSTVFFEIDATNYTMVYIGGNRYEYSWIPNSFGTKFFKIYANDSLNNWNQMSNNIIVQDTTPPNFANLTEISDPLELGNSIAISIDAYDLSNIKLVLLEYDDTNHSMYFIGGNKWFNNTWIPSKANIHQYTIYIQDNANNWNSTSGSIQVIDTTAPTLSNLNESVEILELGQAEIISVDIFDFASISLANIEIESHNYTMTNIGGITWQYNWIPNSTGFKLYTIFVEDLNNNLNYIQGNITVVDTSAPNLLSLIENADPLELGQSVSIQVDIFDFSPISLVLLEKDGVNYSMTNIGGITWYFNNWTPNNIGLKFYTLHVVDSHNNKISLNNNITVVDTIGPTFSNLFISNKTIKIGQSILIQVDIIDFSNVSDVFIEYEGSNYSLNNIFGNTWEYNNWTPSSIGDLSIVIYAKDNNNNWNTISDVISVTRLSSTTNLISTKQIIDFAIYGSIISIIVVGTVLIIRTSKTKRFIK